MNHDKIINNLHYIFNNEATPSELANVMDDAFFMLAMQAAKYPDEIHGNHNKLDEVLGFLHRFKEVFSED